MWRNGNGRWKSCAETTSKIEGEAMKTLRQRYPFSAIVGQEELKQALLLNLI